MRNQKKSPRPPIIQAARAWTVASLRADAHGLTQSQRRACAAELAVAHDRLIAETVRDRSRIGRLLYAPQHVDRWPEIFRLVRRR